VVHLPLELTLQVFAYLDPETLLKASTVAKSWRDRAFDSRLWRSLYLAEGWRAETKKLSVFEDEVRKQNRYWDLVRRRKQHVLQQSRQNDSKDPAIEADDVTERYEKAAWRVQHDRVEADDQIMAEQSSERPMQSEDSVMKDADDVEPSTQPSTSIFGATSRPTGHEMSFVEDDEMYPSPPQSRHQSGQVDSPGNIGPGPRGLLAFNPELFASSTADYPKINWQYLYKQRMKLEQNWTAGRFVNFQLPHPNHIDEGHSKCVYTIQYSRKYLVSGSQDQSLRIWDLDTRRLVMKPLLGHEASVLCLQFDASKEEDIIISGSSDTAVILWRFSTGEMIRKIPNAHNESVLNLRFDKRFLITCSRDHAIRIWNRHELETKDDSFPKPNLPWGSEPGKHPARIIDMMRFPSVVPQPLPPYSLLMTLQGHGAAVNAIQIHGDRIVSASGDKTIKVWDAISGDNLQTINAHSRGIACVQFDGRRIVSGSSDWTVRIFDCATAAEIGHLQGHNHLVRTVQAGFGDIPGSAEDDLAEARALDKALFAGIYKGEIPDFHARVENRRRNAGSKRAENMTAYGAKLPPGGGGSRWARIVSGSYDENVIIWKREKDGSWVVGHRLRQEEAARNAVGTSLTSDSLDPPNGVLNQVPPPGNSNHPQAAIGSGLPLYSSTVWAATNPATAVPAARTSSVSPPNPTVPPIGHPNPAVAPVPDIPNVNLPPAVGPGPIGAPPQPQSHANLGANPAAPVNPANPGSSGNRKVFKLQFDARRIICCSQDPLIVGWDFANGDEEIIDVSRFFIGCS
jgi:F-box and WD-40 domain protein 1/11